MRSVRMILKARQFRNGISHLLTAGLGVSLLTSRARSGLPSIIAIRLARLILFRKPSRKLQLLPQIVNRMELLWIVQEISGLQKMQTRLHPLGNTLIREHYRNIRYATLRQ